MRLKEIQKDKDRQIDEEIELAKNQSLRQMDAQRQRQGKIKSKMEDKDRHR